MQHATTGVTTLAAVGSILWALGKPALTQQVNEIARPTLENMTGKMLNIQQQQQSQALAAARTEQDVQLIKEIAKEQRDLTARILLELRRR
jgi:hypothetical protein